MSVNERLRRTLEGIAWVEMAWLYGSLAQGWAQAGSDYDAAVVTSGAPRFEEFQALREELEDCVQGEVGLAHLNPADTLLCREATSGQLLLRRDHSAHAIYVSRICRLAEDDQLHLRQGLKWWRETSRARSC